MSRHFPPGPNDWLWGARTMSRMKADVLGVYAQLQRDYGDAVSFVTGPYRLFIFFHPDHVRDVLVKHAKSFIRLPRVMKTLAQWNGNSVLIAEGEQWVRQRRLVQPAFHPRRLAGYADTISAAAEELVGGWEREASQSGYVDIDINRVMTGLTLSIICQTMLDAPVEKIAAGDIARAVAILSELAFFEMQAPIRTPLWLPTAHNRRKRWAMKTVDDVVWKFVRQRRADGRDHGDLLSMLLKAVDEEGDGGRLTDRQVRDEVMTLMLAGHDTTAAAFDWLWYNLAQNPEAASACQGEIDRAITDSVKLEDLDNLPVVTAAIKESLRLYPPAFGVILRQTTTDTPIGDYIVPRGQLVTLSSYVTQRDSRWFESPEVFRLERFLGEQEQKIPAGAYFPFGAGPRVCIGQALAMTELTLVAAAILRRFDVEMSPGELEPTPKMTMALRPGDALTLRFKLR